MAMTRRGFLGALLALPLAGLVAAGDETDEIRMRMESAKADIAGFLNGEAELLQNEAAVVEAVGEFTESGGLLVPDGFAEEVFQRMRALTPVREVTSVRG